MHCRRGLDIRVLHSAAGNYLGTVDPEDGSPNCRVSDGYYPDPIKALSAMTTGTWNVRQCMENDHCNGGRGCAIR